MPWAIVVALLLPGCRLYPPGPVARVRRDRAVVVPHTVVASPVACFADAPAIRPCDVGYTLAVANVTRMELEYAGLSIVEGARWNELAPASLHDAGVEGTLTTSLTVGRAVTVSLALRRASDDAVAWTTACVVDAGSGHTVERAIELAARCAAESSSLW